MPQSNMMIPMGEHGLNIKLNKDVLPTFELKSEINPSQGTVYAFGRDGLFLQLVYNGSRITALHFPPMDSSCS